MAANSTVSDEILPKFKLVQSFMIVLFTCKNEEDPSKYEGTRVVTTFLPLKVYADFPKCSRAAYSAVPGLIWLNSEPIRDFNDVLVTCKNEDEPIKNKGARVVITLFIYFSDAQGQLTPQSVEKSCRNSNPSKLFTCKNEEDPSKK